MLKRNLLLGTALACLALLLAAGTSQAQRGGRGGGRIGGSGWQGGGYYQPGWGGFYPGYNAYGQGGYGGYYSGLGAYGQGQYGGGQPSTTYNYAPGYGYGYSTPAPYYGDYGNYAVNPGTNPYRSFYSGPGQQNNTATVHVQVPNPNAKVWFENQETRQQGTQRVFASPPLEQGSTYTYDVRAAWDENGKQITRDKKVSVRPGQEVTVNFTADQATSDGQSQPRQQRQPLTQPRDEQLQPPAPRQGQDQTTETPAPRQGQKQAPPPQQKNLQPPSD